jgi:molecular chaperone GrpE
MADEHRDDIGEADEHAHTAEAPEALLKEMDEIRAKSAEYLEGWQRARAEFSNYKRRVEREQTEAYQAATARVIARFLDVVDDFDRAMQDKPAASDAEALARWADGVGLIQRKLHNILEIENVERIESDGQMFDPNLHDAVTHEESDEHETGQVIGVVRNGFRIGDRVIRPAMVRVAR